MEDCIFCKIVHKQAPSLILYEDELVLSFLALENHPLVIPKKHISDIYELDEQTGAAVMKAAIKIAKALKRSINPDGINLVQANGAAANQDVFHFHLHIKPRWINDDVHMHWEPIKADAKIRAETQRNIKEFL